MLDTWPSHDTASNAEAALFTDDYMPHLIEVPRIDPGDPPADPYVLRRWHRARASLRGYKEELRLLARVPIAPQHRRGFVILSRARSGSTLLVSLMDQLQSVWCDGEILSHAVRNPVSFALRSAKRRKEGLYGFKVLSYQLAEVQALRDPLRFFGSLTQRGFKVIHLTRDSLWQALSITIASKTDNYHVLKSSRDGSEHERTRHHIDVERFSKRLRWNQELLAFEGALMAEVPHLHVHYDRDLLESEVQQQTVNKICDHLDVPHQQVSAGLTKILGHTLDEIAANADEIRAEVRRLVDEGLIREEDILASL